MPEVLDPPKQAIPPQLRRYIFTAANAAQAQAKAAEARRLRNNPPPQAPPFALDERLNLLHEQINLTRKALVGRLEPQHRAALLRALCDLLDQQRIARGEPLPGSRKPGPAPRNDPPKALPEPRVPAACGVNQAPTPQPVVMPTTRDNTSAQPPADTQLADGI